MDIYFEEVPEHYISPAISITIHYKKLTGAGTADEIINLLKDKYEVKIKNDINL